MEDLYDDLENYQYENIVSELKSENQELKCKLEENASTLASLQKDFDKLSSEYKKLELNYSSLLKTARAEIERKSHLITNLNIEKDKLVIEAIQNRGRPYKRNVKDNKQQTGKQTAKERDSAKEGYDAVVSKSTDNNVTRKLNEDRKDKRDKNTSTLDDLKNDHDIKEKDERSNKIYLHRDEDDPCLKNDHDIKEKDEMSKKNYLYRDEGDPCVKNYHDIKEKEQRSKKNYHYKDQDDPCLKNDHDSKEREQRSKKNYLYKDEDDPCLKNDHDIKEKEQKSNRNYLYKDEENSKIENKMSKEKHPDASSNLADANKVSKIRDRRKSMPLMNRGDFKLSSDEDEEGSYNDHRFRRKSPLRADRIETSRVNNDRYREHHYRSDLNRKVTEFTRLGDKSATNYKSSRDAYWKSNNRYSESDRRKSRDVRDKYESSQRFRRQYSPDRPHNVQGEYHNKYRDPHDRHQRFDNVRHRTLVSPPPDKYNQYRRSREFDGQRLQQDGVYPTKHKIHDVIEEPPCKRKRSESINKPSEVHMSLQDRGVEEHAKSMSRPSEQSYLSLQSPDYVHLENYPPVHHIKEIRGTSDTILEDPRQKSKKYIVNTHRDKIVLSTVVGRDVDMRAIDTTMWKMDKAQQIHEMPSLLKEKPPINEDLLKDIYMGIDNPMSNLSIESGEICSDDIGSANNNKNIVAENFIDNECKSVVSHDKVEVNKNKPTDTIITEPQTSPTLFAKNYRIPKIKESNTANFEQNDSTNNTRNKTHKRDSKHSHKKNNKEKRDQDKKLQPKVEDYKSLKKFSGAIDVCKKLANVTHTKRSPEKVIISARDTVEGDLELSDETCDYLEVPEQPKLDSGVKTQKSIEFNKNDVADSISKHLNIEDVAMSDCLNKVSPNFKQGIKTHCENKNFNISHNHDVQAKESLHKPYPEVKCKDIKSKLCDLFGDTSSLITLDDLGIVAPATTKENLSEYAPLYDNTQDAVDLNVEEMEEVQTRSMKLSRDEDNSNKDAKQDEISINIEKDKDKNQAHIDTMKFSNKPVKTSSLQHIFENVATVPEDDSVVKTVIISSGLQNTCNSLDSKHNEDQKKQLRTIQKKTNDNASSQPALLSIKALATSTPYKPQTEPSISVPEISCNSNTYTAVKDANITSSNIVNTSKASQGNSDVPDVRIVVKRRRKIKGAPS